MVNKIHLIGLIVGIIFGLSSCIKMPVETNQPSQQIQIGYGPEDLVIDTISTAPRLLVSCNTRRDWEPQESEIYTMDIASRSVAKLNRIGEPKDLVFNPHGVDLVMERDSLILLVVCHDTLPHKTYIVRYLVKKEQLVYLDKYTHPLFTSPNAVAGFNDGSYIVSSDAKKSKDLFEVLFKIKVSKAVYCKNGNCENADKGVAFGNGIVIKDNKIYRASTRENKVFAYDFVDGKMLNKNTIAKVKGPDNLRFEGNDLLVACHLKSFAFLHHMKDSTKHSPSTIYRITTDGSQKPKVVYFNNGSVIDACATGLIFRNKLYLSQVFDPQVVVVDLEK